MGVMYYSRYFEYFEAARTDLMRALGMTYAELEEQGTFMPVVHAEARYMAGPQFDDHLSISTEIREIQRSRMEIFYEVRTIDEHARLLNTGKTVHAFVSQSGKTVRIPTQLKTLLDKQWGSALTNE